MKNKILFSWTIVILYTLLIFLTLPVLPKVWGFLFGGLKDIGRYIDIIYLIIASGIFIYLFLKKTKPVIYIWLFLMVGVSIYLLKMVETSAEKVHLVEYGFLGYIILYALRQHNHPKAIYLKAAILAIIIGCLDEYIQKLLPNRYGQIRDAVMNIVFSVVGLGVTKIFEIAQKHD